MRRYKIKFVSVFVLILLASCFLGGCTGCQPNQAVQDTDNESSLEAPYGEGSESTQNNSESLITEGIDKARETADNIELAIKEAEEAEPIHAKLGEWVDATDNLAVTVDSVEGGPYDYTDQTPTVKVTVSMRNQTDHIVTVKASNWNADNTDGERVDHKLWIKDNNGNIADRSFELTRISPNSTFTGVVYFDGNGLVDVVYEPHWLISRQNQYIYFECE